MATPLIVRLRNWVGDVVLGIPALQLLEQHGYSLQLIGKGWARSLLESQGWTVHTRPHKLLESVALLKQLRDECAAQDPTFLHRKNALVLPTSFTSALEMRFAGLKAVGYAQEARGFLLTHSEKIAYGGHALDSYWTLACRFLNIEKAPPAIVAMRVSAERRQEATERLQSRHVRRPFVVICPFAGGTFEHLDKTWPHFPTFTQLLLQQLPHHDVIACPGPAGEADIIRDHHPGVHSLEGVSLALYAALLEQADLVISNDTGPAHIAAAVGAPLLEVLGPTKPEQWAPRGQNVHLIQSYPEWPAPAEVFKQALALLEIKAQTTPPAAS